MGEHRQFRFGVTTSAAGSRREWVEKARRIEALGYSTLTIPDHFPDRLATVPALMCAADATERLRLASWVFCNDFRHPALLYKEAATIDLLSDGRFELGIGAGWLKTEYEMTGIPFDPPAVRVARMEEAVRVVKGLAAAGPFDFAGKHYQITGLEGAPKPVQQPHPPLYIGGGGKRLLSFAARDADIVGFGAKALPEGGLDVLDITAGAVRRKLGWVREASDGASRLPELNILIFVFEITDDRISAARRHADALPGLTAEDVLASPHVLIGTPEQMADDLRQRRDEYGFSYIVLNTLVEEHRGLFAPVVGMLAGQ
ncbi:MAG: TIGR03621 family F420-dependent LLM class oxidoreductase [Chloroflexia bacterium]|nr:TIGR03621 family F420-dependent LLM class oxidoreductase [Chloroflexia bacterium]